MNVVFSIHTSFSTLSGKATAVEKRKVFLLCYAVVKVHVNALQPQPYNQLWSGSYKSLRLFLFVLATV